MEKGEYKLVWQSANVAPNGTLSLPIMGDGSGCWQEAFKEIAEMHNRQLRARKWGKVSMAGSVVQVHEVTPGHEAELKAELDELAKTASQQAVLREKEITDHWAAREAELLQKTEDAEEMQARFRAA